MSDWHTDKIAEMTGLLLAKDNELAQLRSRIAELEGARLHNCPVCEQPCNCRYPGAEGEDCECKNYHELEDRAAAAEEALADERETSREYAAELEHLRADHQELSDQFITNAQRLGSVCYSWHNWAVEIVGKEAARRMSGQDMRDEIARRLAGRTTDQAEPRKRRGPGPDGPPKAGDPQDADKDGDL
jgi:hypothetical protein